jgi:hypothetical protein
MEERENERVRVRAMEERERERESERAREKGKARQRECEKGGRATWGKEAYALCGANPRPGKMHRHIHINDGAIALSWCSTASPPRVRGHHHV